LTFVEENLAGRPELVRRVFEWAGVQFNGRSHGHEWRVICPFHDDEHPSLDINDEKATFICRACGGGGDVVDFYARRKGFADVKGAIRDLRQRLGISGPSPKSTAAAATKKVVSRQRWEIRDGAGQLIRFHERLDFDDGTKAYPWYHTDGRKSAKGETQPENLPLYGSEKIAGWRPDELIIVTEGEKAAGALTAHGYDAVGTVTGASGTPAESVLEVLRGHDILLWPDNDTDGAGRRHMERIATLLAPIARSVRILTWGEKPKDDAHDFFARGGSEDQFDRLLAEAPAWTGPAAPVVEAPDDGPRYLTLPRLDDVLASMPPPGERFATGLQVLAGRLRAAPRLHLPRPARQGQDRDAGTALRQGGTRGRDRHRILRRRGRVAGRGDGGRGTWIRPEESRGRLHRHPVSSVLEDPLAGFVPPES
jgi:CHC2 zinc finger